MEFDSSFVVFQIADAVHIRSKENASSGLTPPVGFTKIGGIEDVMSGCDGGVGVLYEGMFRVC